MKGDPEIIRAAILSRPSLGDGASESLQQGHKAKIHVWNPCLTELPQWIQKAELLPQGLQTVGH